MVCFDMFGVVVFVVVIAVALAVFLKVGAEAIHLFYLGKYTAKAKCERDIVEGLGSDHLNWEDVEHLAGRWRIGRSELLEILRNVHRKTVSGDDLEDKVEIVRELLEKYQGEEPYAELPENVSMRLVEVEKLGEEASEKARKLAKSFTTWHVECQEKLKKQTTLAFWGVFGGATSLLIAVLGLYLALAQTQKLPQEKNSKPMAVVEIIQEHTEEEADFQEQPSLPEEAGN